MRAEQQRDLLVHVGDRLLPLAVHVEDLQEGLVDALVRREARLDLVDVADGLVELDRLLGLSLRLRLRLGRGRRGRRGFLGHLDLVALGQKGVEAEDELAVALEEVLDALDDALRVDAARDFFYFGFILFYFGFAVSVFFFLFSFFFSMPRPHST